MVTIQQYEQQLSQRRQTIEAAQRGVEEFKPQIAQTQAQLRKATPLSQARIKSAVVKREEAKQQALQQVSVAQKEQKQSRAKLQDYLKTKSGRLQWARENLTPKQIRKGKDVYQSFSVALTKPGQTGKFKTGSTKIQVGDEVETPYGKVIVPLSAKEARKQSRMAQSHLISQQADILKGVQLPKVEGYLGGVEKHITPGGLVPPPMQQAEVGYRPISVKDLLPERFRTQDALAEGLIAGGRVQLPGLPPTVVTAPSLGERFRGKVRQVTGLSLPGISALKETYSPEQFKKTPEYIVAGTRLFHETIDAGDRAGFTKIEQIKVPDVRYFESGTSVSKAPVFFPLVGSLPIPPGEPKFELPAPKFLGDTTELKTTTLKGKFVKTAGLAAELPFYGATIGAGVYESVKTFRKPVPTVVALMNEQTSELSLAERKEYWKGDEGKAHKQSIEDYVATLKRQKKTALGFAFLGTAALAAPSLYRGARGFIRTAKTARKPVGFVIKPKSIEVQSASVAEAVSSGEGAVGVAKRVTVEPYWAVNVPAYKVWKAKITGKLKVPKEAFTPVPKIDVGVSVFKIAEEKGVGVSATQKFGKATTLKKWEQTYEIQKPTEVVDLSKLSPELRYIAKKLPPREVSEVSSFVGLGQTYKGIGKGIGPKISVPSPGRGKTIFDFPIRKIRDSKAQAQYFIPTKRMEAPFTKTFTRVEPLKIPVATGVEIFATEAAAKVTKGIEGIAKGTVTKEFGLVLIKEAKGKVGDITYIGKGVKQKVKLKAQQAQLAARIQTLLPPKPKPRPFKTTPKAKPSVTLQTADLAPLYVGGLGRGVSRYYGQPGAVEIIEVPAGRLSLDVKPVTAPSAIDKPITTGVPLVYTKPDERIAFVTLEAERERLDEGMRLVGVEKEKEETIFGLGFRTPQRVREIPAVKLKESLREAIIPAQVLETKQIQVFVRPPTQPQRPPRPPRVPRRVKKLFPVVIPSDFKPEKKLLKKKAEEELFIPFVRRYGKFVGFGAPVPRKVAIRKGVAKVRGTLAASLQLRRPSGEIVAFGKETREFRIGKGFTLIQRAPKRLGRRTEVLELIASRRAGAKYI